MAKIVLRRVTKSFGQKVAVDDLNLEVEDGEFVIVVGPSGCGKTTTLRMIAGFETPNMGTLHIGGTLMNHVPPKDRNLAMVFQNYALFPHMSVERNLSFGLRVRHASKKEINTQVHEIAEMLGIRPLLDRKPAQLSGGERQRVALGRALLRKPQAFLLDEPLSNLDAALRTQMRFELKRIHAQFPVTTVYVTHDQVEAMTMADRIVLMNDGELQQVAPPETLYAEPVNVFAAGFIGSPKINLVSARIDHSSGGSALRCLATAIPLTTEIADQLRSAQSETVTIGIRPEDILPQSPMDDTPGRAVVSGTVEVIEPLGAETHIAVRVGDDILTCRTPPRSGLEMGSTINLSFDIAQATIFDGTSGLRLC
ncbi:MAG: glycerol-3-phosphate transporter ATP-binding protein [Actinomycetia bacterium]|nr:glycerol-3-phosphate transporter ATP-binding protein [Actinomycetes bacterium]